MDPIEQLTAADPLPEAERLTEDEQASADAMLAWILADQPRPARRRLRWVPAVVAMAAAIVVALVVIDVVDEEAPGPSVVERAVAAVSAQNSIYHTVAWMGVGGRRYWVEAWYGPDHSDHTRFYALHGKRRGKLLGEAAERVRLTPKGRYAGTATFYDVKTNTIQRNRVGGSPGASGGASVPIVDPSRDPGQGMRELQRQGRLTLEGTTTYAGKKVYRLISKPSSRRGADSFGVVYLVDTRTYYPVYFRWYRGEGRRGIAAESRFLTYERIPLDGQTRKRLEMEPHPGAKVHDYAGSEDSSGGSGGR